jgi:hypothetical protein
MPCSLPLYTDHYITGYTWSHHDRTTSVSVICMKPSHCVATATSVVWPLVLVAGCAILPYGGRYKIWRDHRHFLCEA